MKPGHPDRKGEARTMRWIARGGSLALLLVLLLAGSACRLVPQPWVENTNCTYFSYKPLECQFTIHNPPQSTQPFKWVLVISNPQQIEVTPATSGTLAPGGSIVILAVIHQCPFTITVVDAGQPTKPSIYTRSLPAGGC